MKRYQSQLTKKPKTLRPSPEKTVWTQFWDMHSGGGLKEKWAMIFIEAPEDEAKIIFYNRFGHGPERVTCTCCGQDYSISSDKSLTQLTAYHRNCEFLGKKYVEKSGKFGKLISLKDYLKKEDVKVIYAKDIEPDERQGEVPEQGYVWV